mmetsp:Transcript_20238/g.28467  ORF Transcript_20238/g.28467 Transcript_20238/m.28467 type:complete len:94 (-) Transcript_20238:29-310(-)
MDAQKSRHWHHKNVFVFERLFPKLASSDYLTLIQIHGNCSLCKQDSIAKGVNLSVGTNSPSYCMVQLRHPSLSKMDEKIGRKVNKNGSNIEIV